MSWEVQEGDCLELMAELEPGSVDAIVTDPPYGISFMGREWDCSGPGVEWGRQCLRVLKPGGHLIAFGGTRTVHRLTCAIEDAGFEIRDTIHWCYWSGFPKSLNLSIAIDKAAGAMGHRASAFVTAGRGKGHSSENLPSPDTSMPAHEPITEDAQRWQGWGTALKPAVEPAVLARKPLEGTVAANVLKHGTGALNIDGCRFAYGDPAWVGPNDQPPAVPQRDNLRYSVGDGVGRSGEASDNTMGRWPANLYHCPKASRGEREAGITGPTKTVRSGLGGEMPTDDQGNDRDRWSVTVRNSHPTVKPVALMQWLVKLVTPPGGLVLDPFVGSGTTGIAALRERMRFLGMEREPEYVTLAKARIGEDMPLFHRAP